jgi:hypothetical protein
LPAAKTDCRDAFARAAEDPIDHFASSSATDPVRALFPAEC